MVKRLYSFEAANHCCKAGLVQPPQQRPDLIPAAEVVEAFLAFERTQSYKVCAMDVKNILQIFQSSWSVLGRKQQIFGLAMPTGAEAFEGKH